MPTTSTEFGKAVPSFYRFDLVVPAASAGTCQSAGTRLLLQGASEICVFGRLRSSPRSFGWQSFEVPPQYLSSGDCAGGSWPIRQAAASADGMFFAVAGATGVAVLSRARRAGGRSKRPYSRIAASARRGTEAGQAMHSAAQSRANGAAERASERDISSGRLLSGSETLLSTASGSSHRTEGWRLIADEWEEATLHSQGLCWCRRGVDLQGSPALQSSRETGATKSDWALLVVCPSETTLLSSSASSSSSSSLSAPSASSASSSSAPELLQYKILSMMPDNLSLAHVLHSQDLPPGHRPVLTSVRLCFSSLSCPFWSASWLDRLTSSSPKPKVLATGAKRRRRWGY